jgi:hypothetical protein
MVLPDNTLHSEPGESLFTKYAAQFVAASLQSDAADTKGYDYHARTGIQQAKAFFQALKANADEEKKKAEAEIKAERDAIPSGILLPGSAE